MRGLLKEALKILSLQVCATNWDLCLWAVTTALQIIIPSPGFLCLARKLENMFWRQLWWQEAQNLRWLTYDSEGHQELSIMHGDQPLRLAWPRVPFICNHSLGVGCRMTHKIIQIISNLLLLFMWKNHSFCHIWGQVMHSLHHYLCKIRSSWTEKPFL